MRGRAGDFQVAAQVNGARVAMVLDTGASAVVLTQEAAKAAGLPLEVLSYNVNVDTANGRTRAAAVTLDRIAVGEIVERSVPALIAQPGQLRVSLLGMSFLNRLESWEVRGDKLVHARLPLSRIPTAKLADKAQPRPASRNSPNAISSWRLGKLCASRAPNGAMKVEIGAISAKPISET